MIIRKFRKSDTKEVAQLIKKTFLKYNGQEGGKKSVEKYVSRYSPEHHAELANKLKENPISFIASDGKRVIGIITGNKQRVFQLFVDGTYHGKGVGRKLMEIFERTARKQKSRFINLRSSLYAVKFYDKLGYKKTTGIKTHHRFGDIRYQPMKKELS